MPETGLGMTLTTTVAKIEGSHQNAAAAGMLGDVRISPGVILRLWAATIRGDEAGQRGALANASVPLGPQILKPGRCAARLE